MQELGLIALVIDADARTTRSALPDSPVVPERSPGRARLATAAGLRRLAARLDHGATPAPARARAA
ncbi:hypothetical protein ACQP2X_02675 [Actinoplanes sp. CA-131856]